MPSPSPSWPGHQRALCFVYFLPSSERQAAVSCFSQFLGCVSEHCFAFAASIPKTGVFRPPPSSCSLNKLGTNAVCGSLFLSKVSLSFFSFLFFLSFFSFSLSCHLLWGDLKFGAWIETF